MNKEKGITLITLVVSIILMGILAAVLVRASVGGNLLNEVQRVEDDYYNMINDTQDKTKDIEQKWEGII